jgi:Zn-dependent membrane protease YugP
MIFDPIHLLFLLPGVIIGLIAQARLKSTYGRYLREPAASGLSGAQAAREILDHAGLVQVPVQEVRGHLTDHYDPLHRRLCLSSENFHGRSLAALGVAAHEAGHALQHQAAYLPLNLRMAMVPVTNFASGASFLLVLIGMGIASAVGQKLALLGIGLFALVVFFQLITLPVEYDASRRAKERLLAMGLVSSHERTGVSRVLNAAALTYVAPLVTAVLQLLYLVSLFNRRD